MAIGLALGLGTGTAIGVAIDNLAVGVGVGAVLGAAVGAILSQFDSYPEPQLRNAGDKPRILKLVVTFLLGVLLLGLVCGLVYFANVS